MTVRFPKLLWAPVLIVNAAFAAQNADIGLMLGLIPGGTQAVAGSYNSVSTSVGAGLQFNVGYQVRKTPVGDLWIESPFTFGISGDVLSGPGASVTGHGSFYWTPGVRFKVPVESHISFYGVAGGGLANVLDTGVVASRVSSVTVGDSAHAALDFGGGMDFRLTRLLSFRGEARDFVTSKGLAGASGRNHPFYLFGIAFHF